MGLSQGLYQKQTQKLVLTQDLRNSIKLLELSNIELSEKIEFELEENPLLEEVYNPEKSRLQDLLSVYEKKKSEELDSFKSTDVAWQETAAYDMRRGDSEASNRNQKFIESSAFAKNLGEYLLEQIRLTSLNEDEVLLAEELISMLDGKGFIPESPEEIAEMISVPSEKIRKILKVMHRLDPLGIGARNIQESLLIQAEILFPENAELQILLKEHFSDLEKLDYKKISRSMKLPEEGIMDLVKLVRKLEPFPATEYQEKKPNYIYPDIAVKETEGEFSIFVNDEWIPKLSVNKEYKDLVKVTNSKDKEFIANRVNSAQSFIRSIHQRKQTMMKVMNSIVELQIDFFKYGIHCLKPMTLKDIAERLGMHESTISRVTANKYVQTSWGVLELKWFFSSSLKNSEGEDSHSSKKIQDLMRTLIRDEDKLDPLSDQEISEKISEMGADVARRTVSKYRKILKIPPASRRKRMNAISQEYSL